MGEEQTALIKGMPWRCCSPESPCLFLTLVYVISRCVLAYVWLSDLCSVGGIYVLLLDVVRGFHPLDTPREYMGCTDLSLLWLGVYVKSVHSGVVVPDTEEPH